LRFGGEVGKEPAMAGKDLGNPSRSAHRTWEIAALVALIAVIAIFVLAPKSAWPATVLVAMAGIMCAAMSVVSTRRGRRTFLDAGDKRIVTKAHGTSRLHPRR